MNKILIPSSLIELTGLVQQCLLLAKEQGFSIDSIELGVSPTQCVELVQDQLITSISSDIIQTSALDNSTDYRFLYRSELSIKSCAQQAVGSVFIGVADQPEHSDGKHLDIWRHLINGEVRALSVTSQQASNLVAGSHFAWVLTLLILDFPIEDR